MKDVTGGMAVVSHIDKMWASFSADTGRFNGVEEFISIFESTIEEVLYGK